MPFFPLLLNIIQKGHLSSFSNCCNALQELHLLDSKCSNGLGKSQTVRKTICTKSL